MTKNSNKQSFWERWRFKYRFVIQNSDTFEERIILKLSRLNVFLVVCCLFVFLVGGTTLIIAYSPLKEYIPGYTSTDIRRNIITLNQLSDSLSYELESRERYLQNIRNIIKGVPVEKANLSLNDSMVVFEEDQVARSTEDSLLRERIEEEERFNFTQKTEKQTSIESMVFFKPINGIITQGFNRNEKHYGIDLVSKENELIKCVFDGVVVFASWTSETGHVIAIQHENNFLSIYKHNSVLLKEQGEIVSLGDAIAIIGNSGKFTSGPHLHFELWHNNGPVNPENHIIF
ncbi:MAG: M23 family metallopeptidase [Bacteroidota bacterium]|nr:M23 family metallopeptidase [Bacteroidota bacterium]